MSKSFLMQTQFPDCPEYTLRSVPELPYSKWPVVEVGQSSTHPMLVLPPVQISLIMPMQSWICLTRESYRPFDKLHVYM